MRCPPFFLPKAPADRVPGILTWSQENGADLELIGGFSPPSEYSQTQEGPWTAEQFLGDVAESTIYGELDSGKKVCLWGPRPETPPSDRRRWNSARQGVPQDQSHKPSGEGALYDHRVDSFVRETRFCPLLRHHTSVRAAQEALNFRHLGLARIRLW